MGSHLTARGMRRVAEYLDTISAMISVPALGSQQRELPKWVSKQVWGWGVKREGALGQSQVAHHISNRLLKTPGLELFVF